MDHDNKGSPADIEMLNEALATLVAPWVRGLSMRVTEARAGEVVLSLPVTPLVVHGGGVLCGQAMMAAADTAMILAVMTRLGGFKPMTTVQLQTSFLKPVPGDGGEARLLARVLRMGKSLVFGEILLHGRGGDLAAHATTTYALL
ncbi:MAG: PaaI family thioesterase [Proteobacteria bacterium]|nr:PaaI family thioesterase [Pseudomonadota bacterium]